MSDRGVFVWALRLLTVAVGVGLFLVYKWHFIRRLPQNYRDLWSPDPVERRATRLALLMLVLIIVGVALRIWYVQSHSR